MTKPAMRWPALLSAYGYRRTALCLPAAQAGQLINCPRSARGVGYRNRPSADLAQRVAEALDLPADYFVEYREAVVIDEIRINPALRERLYTRSKRLP